ncbi:MAG: decarboxylase [Pseudomonadota bacterium]
MSALDINLEGATIIAALKSADVEFVVTLPDIVTCDGLLWPMSKDEDFRLVQVCKEDEGVSICAALSYGERRAILMMQHTGLLDSINAIRAIAVEYALPVVMLVGLQGMEPGRALLESDSYGIRILPPLLKTMGVAHKVIDQDADTDDMAEVIAQAYQQSEPFVFLVSRSPMAPEEGQGQ